MSSMSAVQIVHHGSIAMVEFERPPHNHITVQLAREKAGSNLAQARLQFVSA